MQVTTRVVLVIRIREFRLARNRCKARETHMCGHDLVASETVSVLQQVVSVGLSIGPSAAGRALQDAHTAPRMSDARIDAELTRVVSGEATSMADTRWLPHPPLLAC
jgi:hypothetical protein